MYMWSISNRIAIAILLLQIIISVVLSDLFEDNEMYFLLIQFVNVEFFFVSKVIYWSDKKKISNRIVCRYVWIFS